MAVPNRCRALWEPATLPVSSFTNRGPASPMAAASSGVSTQWGDTETAAVDRPDRGVESGHQLDEAVVAQPTVGHRSVGVEPMPVLDEGMHGLSRRTRRRPHRR